MCFHRVALLRPALICAVLVFDGVALFVDDLLQFFKGYRHERRVLDKAFDGLQLVFIQVFENALQSGKLPLDLFFFRHPS